MYRLEAGPFPSLTRIARIDTREEVVKKRGFARLGKLDEVARRVLCDRNPIGKMGSDQVSIYGLYIIYIYISQKP